ncbi:alginate lyase family protein [Baekduia soli]|nr:alginate lyase family protein [Baekduia soli]
MAASAAKTTRLAPTSALAGSDVAGCRARKSSLLAGGTCDWATALRFAVPADVASARLRVHVSGTSTGPLKVSVPATATTAARSFTTAAKKLHGTVRIDVSAAIGADGITQALTVEGPAGATIRFSRPALEVTVPAAGTGSSVGTGTGTATGSVAGSTTPPVVVPPVVPPVVTPPAPAGQALPPSRSSSVWLSPADLQSLPTSGAAWSAVKSAADGSLGTPDVENQDSDHDVNTLAAALVYARTGTASYRAKAAAGIAGAIGTEAGGRTLALARNLLSYVVAADLIDLHGLDPAADARFRAWISAARTENLQGMTLISTHEDRPNNWGTHAGASRIAVDLYLGDDADLARAAAVYKGWLGDRSSYASFSWGDLSFQADAAHPVGIQPVGSTKSGVSLDGALADDMRRGCSFQPVPCHTNYAWEAMQGAVMQAELLSHHGMPAFSWSDNAVERAALYLQQLDQSYGGWWAATDDTWQPWVLNHAYGAHFPATTGGPGKNFGWTAWVYGPKG